MPGTGSARGTRASAGEAISRLFEAVHEGIYIGTLGPTDNRTLAANPHLKLIFGYPAEADASAVRPFDPARFVDPHALDAFLERLGRDHAVTDYLLRLRREDGTPVWVEVTAHADRSSVGSPLRIDALVRDVSERRRLEDQTRDLYHQLLQAEKLAALGQTISGVAHELNNPLATILSWAERLRERPLDDGVRRGVETILGEAERAAKIVRSLLTFARKRHTTRTMVDLNQIVRDTLALRVYEQRVNDISSLEALAAGLPAIFADPHQIKQVLLNLIINAEQAMLSSHGRGMLVVRTWYAQDRDAVVLEVNDDGPGVPEDLRPKIFDPFFTTKEVGKGTGLGLTVAYAIVQEHAGRISLNSGKDGTSFFIELPVGGAFQAPSDTPQPTAADVAVGASVLVAEDEAHLAAAVVEALVESGFTVDRAADGEQALALVRSNTYDLVICDLKMPHADGQTFYESLKQIAPGLAHRVIFVTGDVLGSEATQVLEASGCRWLPKPFRLGDLLRVARQVIG